MEAKCYMEVKKTLYAPPVVKVVHCNLGNNVLVTSQYADIVPGHSNIKSDAIVGNTETLEVDESWEVSWSRSEIGMAHQRK